MTEISTYVLEPTRNIKVDVTAAPLIASERIAGDNVILGQIILPYRRTKLKKGLSF